MNTPLRDKVIRFVPNFQSKTEKHSQVNQLGTKNNNFTLILEQVTSLFF